MQLLVPLSLSLSALRARAGLGRVEAQSPEAKRGWLSAFRVLCGPPGGAAGRNGGGFIEGKAPPCIKPNLNLPLIEPNPIQLF